MRLSLIWVGASLLAGYIGAERCNGSSNKY